MMTCQEKDKREKQGTIIKKNFEEPKLQFIKPKLTKHDNLTNIAFFNGVSP